MFWPRRGRLLRLGAAAALLAVLAAVQVTSVLDDSATFDEGVHLAVGYSYLKTGDLRMNVEHPPLAKALCALPLLWLKPGLPLEHESWAKADLIEFTDVFLYGNRVPADSMLFAARCVTIAFTLLLGAVLALWTRAQFGASVALFALFLFATDPNLIAHGRYVTNDLLVTLFFFLAIAAWARYLCRKRAGDLVWSGVALGLAVLTKFSALLLVPIFIVLYLCRAGQGASRLTVERFFASMLVVAAISTALILPAYGFKASPCEAGGLPGYACTLAAVTNPETPAGHLLGVIARAFRLPDHPFLVGLFMLVQHNADGHSAYLLGQQSSHGWWYYYPVVLLVKTPTALLALAGIGLAIGAGRLARLRLARLRELPFAWIALVVPATMYFASAVGSSIDIGVRHILPVYPLLMVLAAALFVRLRSGRLRRAFPYLAALVVMAQAAESAAIYPHYLAFFNTPAGGPDNGPRYLIDSNIDWGQDLKRLKHYLDANRIPSVCLAYFGMAPPSYFGIDFVPLSAGKRNDPDCVAAISVTMLHDGYLPSGTYAWLRRLKPAAKIGYSIYIYDLRKRKGP